MKKRKRAVVSVNRTLLLTLLLLLLLLIFNVGSFFRLIRWDKADRLLDDTWTNDDPHRLALEEGSTSKCNQIEHAPSFNPIHFMEEGAGKGFLPLFQKQLDVSKQRLLKVRFVRYSTHPLSCNAIYYHIHKNGGSTMNVKDDPRVEAYYTPQEKRLGKDEFHARALQTFQRAWNEQNQPGSARTKPTGPIFTFLRDPISRFLSGVGQSLKLNKLRPCNKQYPSDTVGLIDCVLSKIANKQSFLDEHLEPQAFELYHGMMGMNLTVKVFDMKDIGKTLEAILGPGLRQSASRRRSHGFVAGYNLSSSILTQPLVRRICALYRVDILLLDTARLHIQSACISR